MCSQVRPELPCPEGPLVMDTRMALVWIGDSDPGRGVFVYRALRMEFYFSCEGQEGRKLHSPDPDLERIIMGATF